MQHGFVEAAGHNLEYRLIPAHQLNRPTLVFLHEGLGSLAMWRDFPAKVAAATGSNFVDLGWAVEGREAAIFVALDNLLKGMAGQAVQNMNLALGLNEKVGLWFAGGFPG